VSNGGFKTVDKRDIDEKRTALLQFLRENYQIVMKAIDSTGKLSNDNKSELLHAFEEFMPEEGENDGKSV
jgi:F0F1-type ATP synthase alpha subunit